MIKQKIGPFSLYKGTPNDIKYGRLYTLNVTLPVINCKKRTVRVYLPDEYDEKKSYPVIYMLDGQNIVDKYTSAYGAWDIDVRQKELIKEGYSPFIVVGIDCPKVGYIYRMLEYSFQDIDLKKEYYGKRKKEDFKPYSNLLIDYVANELKPLIDKYFATSKDRELTAIGGSSMGGIAAFNFATIRNDIFGFALCFSPAFHLYEENQFEDYIASLNINPNDYGKFYFYTGDEEFEHLFFQPTIDMYQYFLSRGFTHKQVSLLVDGELNHSEASWNQHFARAIKFWLREEK